MNFEELDLVLIWLCMFVSMDMFMFMKYIDHHNDAL